MSLIKSISGIRGTIGGKSGDGLNPIDIARFVSAYGTWLKIYNEDKKLKVVVGRDARISGEMVKNIVIGSLQGVGIDVINLGLASTPTTELAVTYENADGGLILTASHNPKQWNALKMLNSKGEFLSATDGTEVLAIAENENFYFADVDNLGTVTEKCDYDNIHIENILKLKLVDVEAIRRANFKVVIDCVNSVGGIIIPKLLNTLGVNEIVELYCEPNGLFPHNPEPLPEHLEDISNLIKKVNADVGFVVDPDVDRLAIINEDGTMFGEEYTLVAIADYVLSQDFPNGGGSTVSNLSSTRALRDITEKYGGLYFASAVGEVNVVEKMKEVGAIIGGEGNGGVIYPQSHYGRDALVGIALFLSFLAKKNKNCSELKKEYPLYFISKNKILLNEGIDIEAIFHKIKEKYKSEQITDIDGIKIDFENKWIHFRTSNTEPIIRIYSEAKTEQEAKEIFFDNIELCE
ncbi:MAG: phosphoglucosamine mutase [Marinilabiliaceae bacterium]|nr:phosphoglucosamine mutase [Marinilabiliaceae bacterium]